MNSYRIGIIKQGTVLLCLESQGNIVSVRKGGLYICASDTIKYPTWIRVFEDTGYVQDFPLRLFRILIEP